MSNVSVYSQTNLNIIHHDQLLVCWDLLETHDSIKFEKQNEDAKCRMKSTLSWEY